MRWQKDLLIILSKREDKKIALAVDTSTTDYPTETISNIVKLVQELRPGTPLIQADYKIRETATTANHDIQYYTHGKSSYTEVLEWANENEIETLFYITDVTGYVLEEMEINYELFWLIPGGFSPKVPFGKKLLIK
ncbi:VWA-like domain-containing protein [Alkalihalobacterium alkalinitrilicum]|uniref:VWA-like domain-containing protein n=1 Tax=Alkalihalobacterium alkalinitrilicum TaxID=427920 RepID=UPI0009949FF8|nr:VWA-like domain-containing protein [Alkalihalobacterium alkalinitrilicum]